MIDKDYLYPSEIREAWLEAIENLNLPPEEAKVILSVIQYAQPPLALDSLVRASEIYTYDTGAPINSSIIKEFKNSLDISHSKPKGFAKSHPVFYAFTHPKKLGNLDCQKAQHARKILSDIFYDAAPGEMVSRSQFYQHAIAVRDVLISLTQSDWEANSTTLIDEGELLMAVHSDSMYGQKSGKLNNKIETFEMMIKGDLEPAKIKYKRTGGGSGSRGGKKEKWDMWHEERLKSLAKTTQEKSKNNTMNANPGLRIDTEVDNAEHTALQYIDIQMHKQYKERQVANEDTSETLYLQRQTPNLLTPSDDHASARYWLSGAPTSSIKGVTDVGRLTPDIINLVMDTPLESICKIYASLLVSTGLPPARLSRLSVHESHALEKILKHGDQRPYWLPELKLLCFKLLDGPVKVDSCPAANWVILQLPEAMASKLSQAEKEIKKRPFHGTRSALNRQLAKNFKHVPGITPTANRLSASSWLYCRPHAIDDVAAAALTGQFGLGMAAPAAYRKIPRNEYQHIFENALQNLGWGAARSDKIPLSTSNTTTTGLATAGSVFARTPDEFSAIFGKLRHAMRPSCAQLSGWWTGEPIPLSAVTELHQLVSAYELLAWQLSTGARPIGASSKNHLENSLQWIHDKNSSIGKESRVIPLLSSIANSLALYKNWTHSIIYRLKNNGVTVNDKRTGIRQTPDWMELSKNEKAVKLRDMTWRDFATLPFIDVGAWPYNTCRHSAASWLRHYISDAQVDHLLGHTRHGRMLSSPQSETSLGQQHELRNLLTDWLKRCGYRPLEWTRMPWK